MNPVVLLEEDSFRILRHEGIPAEALAFLDEIAWGSEGAVYENKNTKEHSRHIHRPVLMAIHSGDQILATAVFCHTKVGIAASYLNCYYVRYFASSPKIRGQGLIKKYGIRVMELVREDVHAPTVFCACVERGNKPSFKTVQSAGYQHTWTATTNGFSRFFPRSMEGVEQVTTPTQREEVLALLGTQYREHALVQFDSIFLHDQYYILRIKGQIVAGLQYHRAHWVVNRMAGWSGKLLLKILPQIPLLNRIFNPNKFEFLALEGIYIRPGFEKEWGRLVEDVLVKTGMRSAMYWMGATCPIRERIQGAVGPGLLHPFVKDSDVYVMASFHDVDKGRIQQIQTLPLYASGFDYV